MLRALYGTLMLSALVLAAACSGQGGAVPGASTMLNRRTAADKISHVVIVLQENRSFEDFFAGYPGADAPMTGCGAPQSEHGSARRPAPASIKCPPGDDAIRLHQVTFKSNPNLEHLFQAALIDWNDGKMDGFSHWGLYGRYHHTAAYAYVDRAEVAPYWSLAHQYVLADAMFPTEFGPSWTAHLTLVAGTDNIGDKLALADFADGKSSCKAAPGTKTTTVNARRVIARETGPFPCLDQFNTMASALDEAGVSWKYYTARVLKAFIWSPFAAIKYVFDGPDWENDLVQPQTRVLTDAAQGNLASVSWVTPSKADSDHPGAHSDTGPSWVASVINAIGESPYWNSTAIVVLWDDWGGLYDNAPPPQLDFRGLGIRVPCLIISPYAKRDYVDHTQYEFGSVLKFIEEVFPAVKPLGRTSAGYTDRRAASLDNAFDFSQPPRAFVPIKTKYPPAYFFKEPLPTEPVDEE